MKVRVLGFATVSDILGSASIELELDDGANLDELQGALIERFPPLAAIWTRLAVAVDGKLMSGGDAAREAALRDGAEVALLPPVSGGATAPGRAAIVDGPIDAGVVERLVADPACGAVVLFLGTVRDHHDGRPVERLTYTAYRAMAEKALARIVADLEADGEVRPAIVHRLGEVPVGEPSVVIAVASAHRQAAYEASRTALERLKREVPIWKREHYGDGTAAWREEEPLTLV